MDESAGFAARQCEWRLPSQSHFKLRTLLKYEMDRVSGHLVEREDEYTSRICPSCDGIDDDLDNNSTHKCSFCHIVRDQDLNAAKNIFHNNMQMLD